LKFSRRPATIAATSSRLTLEQVVLSATSLTGLAYATEELLSASPSTFAAIIAAGFDDELGGTLLREKIRGVGGSEFLGVLGAPGTITVAAEGGQAADTITGANVMAMSKRCWGYSSAIWIANPDARSQLTQAHVLIEGSTGGGVIRLFQPAQAEGEPDRLDGRACFFSEHASALGDPGDLILGNWSQYLDGLYQPLQSAESVHVRFVEHERTLKFWVRNAGAPWWRSALTPAEGANTLSPFVVLEERS
jgi:HK97 family phage major capsid protein